MAQLADYAGSVSGDDCVKDAVTYDFTWGKEIHVPMLDASPCVFKCRVSQTHLVGISHTFFGEAVNLHLDLNLSNPPMDSREAILEWFNSINIHDINPLVYHSFPLKSIV